MINFLLAGPSLILMLVLLPFCAVMEARHREDKRWSAMLIACCLVFPAMFGMGMANHITAKFITVRLDHAIYPVEAWMGLPSWRIAAWLKTHIAVYDVLLLTYNTLIFAAWTAYAANLWLASKEDARRALHSFVGCICALPLLYIIFPVEGPAYAFHDFPLATLREAVPNGMPSGHMAVALLVIWHLWKFKWGRIGGIAYALLTVVATLGLGEHYVLDLIAGVPYAAFWVWITVPVHYPVSAPAALPSDLQTYGWPHR